MCRKHETTEADGGSKVVVVVVVKEADVTWDKGAFGLDCSVFKVVSGSRIKEKEKKCVLNQKAV